MHTYIDTYINTNTVLWLQNAQRPLITLGHFCIEISTSRYAPVFCESTRKILLNIRSAHDEHEKHIWAQTTHMSMNNTYENKQHIWAQTTHTSTNNTVNLRVHLHTHTSCTRYSSTSFFVLQQYDAVEKYRCIHAFMKHAYVAGLHVYVLYKTH